MDAFITSSITVTLAEIGDKTQLLSLLLAARFSNKPAIVAGILVATLLNHAASAWVGNWLGESLLNGPYQWIIGVSFIVLGFWILIPDKESDSSPRSSRYGAFLVTAVVFFMAEIGDKTQIATIALGAEFMSVLAVTLGTTLGMLAANIPVVYAGDAIMRRIPLGIIRLFAATLFVAIGLYQIALL